MVVMPTYQEALETAHRKQFVADAKRASELGLNTYEFRGQRKAAVEQWTTIIRELMDQCRADDPVSVLPQIAARILEDTAEIARKEAEVAARSVVQRMLKRAMTPL
jgi:hypothetical protein